MLRKSLVIILLSGALSGCAVTKPYTEPTPNVGARFVTIASGLSHEEPVTLEWWTRFDDAVLNELVEEGLASNLDLHEAVTRVEAARAFRTETVRGATFGGGASAAQRHAGSSGDRSRTASAGVDLGWELDLFSRIRNLGYAAEARAKGTEALLEQTRILVAAEIAGTYLSLRASQERIVMLEQYRADQSEIVKIIAVRVEEGLDGEADLARARTVEAGDDLALAEERHNERLLLSALAILTGSSPIGFDVPSQSSPAHLSLQEISIGDPATLLQRRPDVRAAERELSAQTAEVGVATAGLFPQLRIGGVVNVVAGSIGNLFSSGTDSWAGGPALTWGIFDLSGTRAQIRRERAEAEGALAAYERAVLRALQDSQDAFSAYAAAQETLVATDQQVRSARLAAELIELQYEEGMVAYFEYLDARRTAVRAEIARIDGIASHRLATVNVFRALGAI